jgi:diaminopimelate epimerase
MSYSYAKYHALGNDYIVIDPNDNQIKLTRENIILICHRNFGVGSDGILYGPLYENNTIKVRIFNPDGSEAEKSGNGIRIFARYLRDRNHIKEHHFCLTTIGGKVNVEYLDDKGYLIKVDMGNVTFDSALIPVNGMKREVINEPLKINDSLYNITCLSIGNPHCVIPMETISKDIATHIGPLIENHVLFPNRINVQFLKVLDRHTIQIEIWERGAGYTMASGSSSCAAASVAYKLGLVENKIAVHMPGGVIDIEIHNDKVFMTGPVTGVVTGEFTGQFVQQLTKTC